MKNEHTATEVTEYGRAFAKTLQSFAVLESKASWFERLLIRLLRARYRQRLRVMVAELPAEVVNEVFEGVGGGGAWTVPHQMSHISEDLDRHISCGTVHKDTGKSGPLECASF